MAIFVSVLLGTMVQTVKLKLMSVLQVLVYMALVRYYTYTLRIPVLLVVPKATLRLILATEKKPFGV